MTQGKSESATTDRAEDDGERSAQTAVRAQRPGKASHQALAERNLPILAQSTTFARMLRPGFEIAAEFRRWGWPFALVCDRKDQATLTDTEKERYICAFNMINNDGTLGKLVDIHSGMHMQHMSNRLLPWHRVFLHLFEEALHNYHPDVCVPYWNWTNAGEQHFPDWLAGVLPTVHTPTRTISVIRSPGTSASLASIASGVSGALGQTTYDSFTGPINGIHGGVHIWVGGTMSDASVSPADPVFWLHHANLDRLWWKWYNSPQGNHQNPTLTGSDALMDPWTFTETDVRDIATLGYAYV